MKPKRVDQKLSGAQAERNAVRSKLARLKRAVADPAARDVIDGLLAWLSARTARYNRRPGGLQSNRRRH